MSELVLTMSERRNVWRDIALERFDDVMNELSVALVGYSEREAAQLRDVA